jgi:osmotically-inducible protein OsmY
MHKPNKILEMDVLDSLDWDPQIDDTRINVAADKGTVTLTGSVPSYFDSARAVDDTTTVRGVTDIDNQLLVGLVGDAITDAEIAVACAAALSTDRFVPNDAVTADVIEGFVTLNGQVRRHYQRQAAEFAVSKVDGVLGVYNAVTLTNAPLPGDVAERIGKALERSSMLDNADIDVTNDGATIFLDGTTTSWNARQQAEDTAWAAPGVMSVVDRIAIVP